MVGADQLIILNELESVGKAEKMLTEQKFSFLPVVDVNQRYIGKVTTLRLTGLIQEIPELLSKKPTFNLGDFVASSDAIVHTGITDRFEGVVSADFALSGRSAQPIDRAGPSLYLTTLPDEDIRRAIEQGASVIVRAGTREIADETVKTARKHGACLIACPAGPLEAVIELVLAMPLGNFTDRNHPTFHPEDRVRDVQKQISKYNEGGFIVIDDSGAICGVITRVSFLTRNRFRVALVDHNEYSQAVDGIEDAEVTEIIDHHRLGNRATDSPITFVNKVVGSTATIVAEICNTHGFSPDPAIAGLLLSAILSDTVILNSPTSSPLDREMAEWLANRAGIEIQEYGERMFAAGSELADIAPEELITRDQKVYTEGEIEFSVSQIELVGYSAFYAIKDRLASALAQSREKRDFGVAFLMVTDITEYSSLLLATGNRRILDAIGYPRIEEGLYEMKNVLSRKKQLLPYMLEVIRGL